MLRLKGYDFTFRPESEAFIPEPDFVPFVWQRKGKHDSDDNGMEEGGSGDTVGQGGASDNSASNMAIDPSPVNGGGRGGGQSHRTHTSHVLMGIAVTPFNPNPQTPMGKELLQMWKDAASHGVKPVSPPGGGLVQR